MTEQKKENIELYFPFGPKDSGLFRRGQGAWVNYIHDLQNRICAALEKADGKEKFREDQWERAEGGGGITRAIANGNVFEKGGVNTSVVWGDVSNAMRTQLKHIPAGNDSLMWWACGLSLVLHPVNPFVPTVHCNYRMFELYKKTDFTLNPPQESRGALARWFGGGTDLTPYYLFDEDAKHFHGVYKKTCDGFDLSLYPDFKKQCDQYFVNTHPFFWV